MRILRIKRFFASGVNIIQLDHGISEFIKKQYHWIKSEFGIISLHFKKQTTFCIRISRYGSQIMGFELFIQKYDHLTTFRFSTFSIHLKERTTYCVSDL